MRKKGNLDDIGDITIAALFLALAIILFMILNSGHEKAQEARIETGLYHLKLAEVTDYYFQSSQMTGNLEAYQDISNNKQVTKDELTDFYNQYYAKNWQASLLRGKNEELTVKTGALQTVGKATFYLPGSATYLYLSVLAGKPLEASS